MGRSVRELTAKDHARLDQLRSCNGIGFDLRGHTAKDPDGLQFATRWFTILGFPLIPLGRYLIEERETFIADLGVSFSTTDRFAVHGASSLRPLEVLGTYVWSWLVAPAVVVVPFIQAIELFDANDNDASTWWLLVMLAGVITWPVVAVVLLVLAVQWRRNRVRPTSWLSGA